MCDPVTVSVVSTVASTAFSVVQAAQQAKDQKAVAAYNARVSENTAQKERNLATEKENTQRLKTSRLLSKQRAQLGAANIDLTSGSALQLQEDTLTLGEADALRIRQTGDDRFSSLIEESNLETSKGEMAESQGLLNIGGSLLSGTAGVLGSGVADKWFTEDSVGQNIQGGQVAM